MWVYEQSSGKLLHDGQLVGEGYSGHGKGVNNPKLQDVHDTGPIPQGEWRIGEPYDQSEHGPCVMQLTPEPGTETFGRTEFLMHGDLKDKPGQLLASKGCIIMPRWVRDTVARSGDNLLKVTA